MPLVRRIPKRGFNNRWAQDGRVVNLGDLNEAFEAGDEVTPESLAAKNLAQGDYDVAEGSGRRRADQEAQDLRPPLQQVGRREDRKGGRRGDRAARPAPVVKKKKASK